MSLRIVGGRVELLHSIGAGACATVWLGRHRDTGALLAVKLLEAGTEQAEPAARFRREAEIAARLTHRNLVRVFDYVHEADGSAALVMEHLRGETLEDVIARHGSLPPTAAVACIAGVLRGLEHAHERGVIHRDLKPSNVFVAVEPDGYVLPKVLDFGVAKLTDERAIVLTQHGHIVGTPAYMSPEQVRGEHVGIESDLFSAGAMLFEMLTGQLAFRAPSPHAAMLAIIQRELEPHPAIPEAVWAVLERALRKDPAERHASAAAFREALESCVQYTEPEGADALRALAPVVSALPELPARVPSSPSLTPPSLHPVAADRSAPLPAGLTVTAAARLVTTPRGKLWGALAACAAIALVGGSALRSGPKPPALSMRAAAVARSAPPPAAQPAPATVEAAPPAVSAKAVSKKSGEKPVVAEPVAAPAPRASGQGPAGVAARARHVARTPGF